MIISYEELMNGVDFMIQGFMGLEFSESFNQTSKLEFQNYATLHSLPTCNCFDVDITTANHILQFVNTKDTKDILYSCKNNYQKL